MTREARLVPDWVSRYQLITPGHWYPAIVISEYLGRRYAQARNAGEPPRSMPDEHFEFRGGVPRAAAFLPSRRSDPKPGKVAR